ncbi:HAD family hydrolase [Natronosalvus vescus]|uniref:HAD family hydrolase n=1 Tax=Natronosalvus vescus TaxID=2953881 RepID=UPI002090063E|nr:HAD family hydrolase [Natronosalvus vescus]
MHTCYFDLDGTLVEFDVPYATLYDTALERLGVEPAGASTFSERFFEVFGTVDDPYAAAIEATAVEVEPAAFSDSIVETEIEHTEPITGAKEILEALSEEYRLGVLTNGLGHVQRAKLEAVGLDPWVETIVVADEVDAWKPEPAIYRVAEERLPADSHTFVADDLERDVVPAIECGWRGVYVGATDGDSTQATVLSIEKLEECLEIL